MGDDSEPMIRETEMEVEMRHPGVEQQMSVYYLDYEMMGRLYVVELW
jgi:hypothetical protein